jgi:large subunit ribosomal protein L37e
LSYNALHINSGTGRMSHLKDVNRRFKNGFREGGAATKRTKTESA